MARKKTTGLTEAELRIMNVLWNLGEGTVAEVQAELADHKAAYTTVLTVIQILETKRYVTHTSRGRAYVYRPALSRAQVRRAALQNFLATWFDASPDLLVANLLDERSLDAAELEKAIKAAAKRPKQ